MEDKDNTEHCKLEMSKLLSCPVCKREWPEDCEQGRAVTLRNKCIVCIAGAHEDIKMDPYEFRIRE